MKANLFLCMLLVVIVALSGCSEKEDQKENMLSTDQDNAYKVEYYLLSKGNLLFAPTFDEELLATIPENELGVAYPEATFIDFSATGFDPNTLKVGERIKVWYTEVRESFPPQIVALRVETN